MQRHVFSLPISNDLKNKIVKNGFENLAELTSLKPTDLIKDYGFTRNEITELNDTLNIYKTSKPVSVYELMKTENRGKISNITTLSKNFDDILEGGIPLKKIAELAGAAGLGKTQLCMQLCVNVQIPEQIGGLEGQAVYIDTEGSFISKRVIEIANATVKLIGNENLETFTVEKILKNIFYYRCVDQIQLVSTINNLDELIKKNPKIRLIIVDSLAYPFRFVDYKDTSAYMMKTNILNNFMMISFQLIDKYDLSILVTNQMTTKITRDVVLNTSNSNLVPALGEAWAHAANLRIILKWKNGIRNASVCKSSYLRDNSFYYKITPIGFEDINEEDASINVGIQNLLNPTKKRKPNDDEE